VNAQFFDTPRFEVPGGVAAVGRIVKAAMALRINLGYRQDGTIHVALDETTDAADVEAIVQAFAAGTAGATTSAVNRAVKGLTIDYPRGLARTSAFLTHPVFNTHHSGNADDA
jgi:glycine dehydrogenase